MEGGNLLPLWQVATYRELMRRSGETTATSRRIPKRRQVAALQNFSRPLLKEPLYEFHFHVIPRLALELFVLLLHAQITVSRLIIFWRARNAAV